jgi:hypothetical protein
MMINRGADGPGRSADGLRTLLRERICRTHAADRGHCQITALLAEDEYKELQSASMSRCDLRDECREGRATQTDASAVSASLALSIGLRSARSIVARIAVRPTTPMARRAHNSRAVQLVYQDRALGDACANGGSVRLTIRRKPLRCRSPTVASSPYRAHARLCAWRPQRMGLSPISIAVLRQPRLVIILRTIVSRVVAARSH